MDERLGKAPAPEVGLMASGVLAGVGALLLGGLWMLMVVPAAVVLWSGRAAWNRTPPYLMNVAMACGIALAAAGAWDLISGGFRVAGWVVLIFGVVATISALRWKWENW